MDRQGVRPNPGIVMFLPIIALGCSIASVVKSIALTVPSAATWPAARLTRDVSSIEGPLSIAWTRDQIYARQDSAIVLSAADGYLALAGSEDENTEESLFVMETRSGRTLWSGAPGYTSTLLATGGALFAGTPGQLSAYSPDNGRVLWSSSLPASRSPREIYLVGDHLHVNTARQVFHLLDPASGGIIQTREYGSGEEVFLIIDDTLYEQAPTLDTLRAVSVISSEVKWATAVSEAFYSGPVLARDKMLIRTGIEQGRVAAVEQATGTLLWEWPEGTVVSNVSILNEWAGFLTIDGTLVLVDLASGEPRAAVTFSGGPFVAKDEGLHPFGYHVAADEVSQRLFILLGDSRQLFALTVSTDSTAPIP